MAGPGRFPYATVVGAALLAGTSAAAQTSEVDIELVLAVDVSRSMDFDELLLQRDGYAAAFRHPDVIGAVERGLIGRIAVSYVEWAGAGRTRLIVPWTVIAGPEDAHRFAEALQAVPPRAELGTSISNGIDYARGLFAANDVAGLRRVIDISGDGPNNRGRPVTEARDEALADGIVINGLPLQWKAPIGPYNIRDLDLYYEDCVIGGAGAFLIPVYETTQFRTAVRRKLILEIAGLPARVQPVQLVEREPMDCLIGERQRERRFRPGL